MAHGPSEAHMKTEEGHSSPAPGYLCKIDRVINKMIQYKTNDAHLWDHKVTPRNMYESDPQTGIYQSTATSTEMYQHRRIEIYNPVIAQDTTV